MGRSFCAIALLSAAALGQAGGAARAGDWPRQRRDGRFVVRADLRSTDSEQRFAEFAQIEGELTRTLGLPRASGVIELYLLANEATYQRHIAQVLPSPTDRRAMYVQLAGRQRVYAFRSKELSADLRHECAHALLHASLPALPLWLDEGLAEYFETPAADRVDGSPHLAEVQRLAARGRMPVLARLERIDRAGDLTADDYRDAWAWVHFLLHGAPGGGEELSRYLAEFAADPASESLAARLVRRWPDVEERFARHFRQGRKSAGKTR